MDNGATIQLIKFEVGGKMFCLPLEVVDEVFPELITFNFPQVNKNIDGITIPRDSIITIVNLGRFLSLRCKTNNGKVISVSYRSQNIGFKVDNIAGISTSLVNKEPLEDNEYQEFTYGWIMLDDNQVIVLDYIKIIDNLLDRKQ